MPYSEINRVKFGNSLVLKALVFCFLFRFRQKRMAAALTLGDRRVLEQEWSIFFRVIIVVFFFCAGWGGGVRPQYSPLKFRKWWLDTGFHHQMKHWEESWKYDGQRSTFDQLRVEYLILLLKQDDFRRRNYGCKNELFFIWCPTLIQVKYRKIPKISPYMYKPLQI